jgi:hypothetical protein
MTTTSRKAEDLQKKGTREFDEAVAGKGPKMPARQTDPAEEAELNEALEESFPASDPPKVSSSSAGLGAPKGRKSAD